MERSDNHDVLALPPRWQLHYLFKDFGASREHGGWHERILDLKRMPPEEARKKTRAILERLARKRREEKLVFAILWSVDGEGEYDTEGPRYIFSVPPCTRQQLRALIDKGTAELFISTPQT